METISPFEFLRLKNLAEDLLREEKYVIHDPNWKENLVESLATRSISFSSQSPEKIKDLMWSVIPSLLKKPDILAKPKFFN